MNNTLPNEPLNLIITEAGSENLLYRSLLRQAMLLLIIKNEPKRRELADLIATTLDERTPETCPVCEEIIFTDCQCGGYPSREQLNAMEADKCAAWEAQYGRNITDAEAQEADEVTNFFDLRFEN